MLSPSFRAKRNRSHPAGQQNTLSEVGSGTCCWSCSQGCSVSISLSTVLASVWLQQHWDLPNTCFCQTHQLQSFLEALLPLCSKELTSLKAPAFFTKPLIPLSPKTTILPTGQGILHGWCLFYLLVFWSSSAEFWNIPWNSLLPHLLPSFPFVHC